MGTMQSRRPAYRLALADLSIAGLQMLCPTALSACKPHPSLDMLQQVHGRHRYTAAILIAPPLLRLCIAPTVSSPETPHFVRRGGGSGNVASARRDFRFAGKRAPSRRSKDVR